MKIKQKLTCATTKAEPSSRTAMWVGASPPVITSPKGSRCPVFLLETRQQKTLPSVCPLE